MALESYDNSINITHLNIESPERKEGLPFVPSRDIPEKLWKDLESLAEDLCRGDFLEIDLDCAYGIKILDQERFNKVRFVEGVTEGIEQHLYNLEQQGNREKYLEILAHYKIAFPDNYRSYEKNETYLSQCEEWVMEASRDAAFYAVAAGRRWKASVLIPNLASQHFSFDSRVLEFIKHDLIQIPKDDSSWAEAAMSLRLLSPGHFKKLEITPEDWKLMRSSITTSRQAIDLQFIAAKDIVYTDGGITFVPPEQTAVTNSTPGLPEIKNF